MLAAGAAESHRQIGPPLLEKGRQQRLEELRHLAREGRKSGIAGDIVLHGRIASVLGPKLFRPMRILQKPAVEDQICAHRQAAHVGKALDGHRQVLSTGRRKQARHFGLELMRGERACLKKDRSAVAQRGEQFTLQRDARGRRVIRGQGVAPPGFRETAQQNLGVTFQINQIC